MRLSVFAVAGILAVFCQAGTALGDEVENPAYAAWAKCKPGSTVTFSISLTAATMAQEAVITQKLIEVKPAEAIIEIKTQTKPNGETRESTTVGRVPAKVEKGKEYLPINTPVDRVTISDIKEGAKETVTIQEKKVEAGTREFTMSTVLRGGSAEQKVKFWTSGEVPGGTIKYETTGSAGAAGEVKTVMEVKEYDAKR